MKIKAIMTPAGGHGTVFLLRRMGSLSIAVAPRSDTVFGRFLDPYAKPSAANASAWARRSHGIPLNLKKTIGENFLNLFDKHPGWILLCGYLSANHTFLTDNDLQAIVIVRHPVDAYLDFILLRHPEKPGKWYGSKYDDIRPIQWYARMWNSVVCDAVYSGSKILRYENLEEESKNEVFYPAIKGRWAPPPFKTLWNKLPKDKIELMKTLTDQIYTEVYGSWD